MKTLGESQKSEDLLRLIYINSGTQFFIQPHLKLKMVPLDLLTAHFVALAFVSKMIHIL